MTAPGVVMRWDESNAENATMMAAPNAANAARTRVLVVDDDPAVLETVEALLEDDFEVACCESAEAALKRLESGSFDVICSDYKMPNMSGTELLGRIAKLGLGVGAVLITGNPEEYYRESPPGKQNVLPVTVVTKPYAAPALIDAINRAAAFGRMRRAVAAASRATNRLKERGE